MKQKNPTQSHESAYLYHDCHFSWHLYAKNVFCVHTENPLGRFKGEMDYWNWKMESINDLLTFLVTYSASFKNMSKYRGTMGHFILRFYFCWVSTFFFKGIVHFEMIFWYVLAYLKGIQDVGVFVSAVVSILIFLG